MVAVSIYSSQTFSFGCKTLAIKVASKVSIPSKQKVLILCGFSQIKTFCFFNLFAFHPLFSSIFSSHAFAARV